jgi:GNAT superfamily N-acetyltransferase
MTARVTVRDYDDADWPHVWPVIEQVVRAGDTFPFPVDLTEAEARSIWLENGPGGRVTVAVDGDGDVAGAPILGTAKMGRNRPGPGSHVSTASYMVAAEARGSGVGRALVVDSLEWARESGYAAMQFNAVVETNTRAVALWQSFGFEILTTVPEAFRHPVHGLVGLHVMYRRL